MAAKPCQNAPMDRHETRAAQARQAIEAKLAELDEQDRISAEGRAPVTLQQDAVERLSRMDAMQQQAMAQATERRRKSERLRLRAALERIEEDEWGFCLSCGEEIAPKRLDHDPAASQCLRCAQS